MSETQVFSQDEERAQQPLEQTVADNSKGPVSIPIPAAALVGGHGGVESVRGHSPEELKAAQEGWLERRGIDLARVPRLTMGEREFDLFRNFPSDNLGSPREIYNIPADDQDNAQYALVDRKFDDPGRSSESKLMIVNDTDFGTIIDREIIANDFQDSGPASDDPSTPERPGGAYAMADIRDSLTASREELSGFARGLMQGKTTDPFMDASQDIAVRAGGIAPGQKDAYVWTQSPMTKSVELTIAFPGQYDSVCVVGGHMREAGNGKSGMAQIDNPVEVLKIKGQNLERLQNAYRNLYREPDFKLTDQQRSERDKLFNDHVVSLISQTAHANKTRQHAQQPKQRARG